MDVREKLIGMLDLITKRYHFDAWENTDKIADYLIANGVTVQEWITASKPPKENGYYLCVILFSSVGNKKEYRRKILFWEGNVWIEMTNCFRTVKPLYWIPMAEMPQPPKEE